MVNKKIPLRTCVVTKEKLPKKELLRIVRTPEQEIIIDLKGKSNGRGAYIKKDLVVLAKAQEKKILDKHLEVTIPDQVYEEMKKVIEVNNGENKF